MKVWITKYWDTKGILQKKAERCDLVSPTMIRISGLEYYHNGQWYPSLEKARERVTVLRDKKIKSLKKKLAKLEALFVKTMKAT